jgi:hypothetical protein
MDIDEDASYNDQSPSFPPSYSSILPNPPSRASSAAHSFVPHDIQLTASSPTHSYHSTSSFKNEFPRNYDNMLSEPPSLASSAAHSYRSASSAAHSFVPHDFQSPASSYRRASSLPAPTFRVSSFKDSSAPSIHAHSAPTIYAHSAPYRASSYRASSHSRAGQPYQDSDLTEVNFDYGEEEEPTAHQRHIASLENMLALNEASCMRKLQPNMSEHKADNLKAMIRYQKFLRERHQHLLESEGINMDR